ncbi:hypothetical protein JMUB5695_01220 [Mycobacterium heckeshornense]|uniref:Transposase n=1 Tax=Mycobacterium heckeshornense TaxID=110505 RepID=A0A7R7TTD3_9MYCO|nr:hypothetical protein [Mycobacterium heckeshornense]BCO34641.1 hypothetical protein MHEC_10740 [Mycobacterium heckeshornense]BCQ07797.1 hypothetical protein JMUB5695_01220 [Mycobacterium heckeshornense]
MQDDHGGRSISVGWHVGPSRVSCTPSVEGKDGTKATRSDQDAKAEAVRLVRAHRDEYGTDWAVMRAISARLGMSAGSLHKWVRQAEIDDGKAAGVSTVECRELRQKEP